MKKIVLGGASALALTAMAGAANAQGFSTGYVGVSRTAIEDITYWSLSATGAMDVSSNFEVQGDLQVSLLDYTPLSDPTIWSMTAHGFWDGGAIKAGAFVAYQDFDNSAEFTAYGLEARGALSESFSLAGSYGMGELEVGTSSIDVEALRGELSTFFSDRTRMDIGFTALKFDLGVPGVSDLNSTVYAVGIEHQLEEFPYSITFNFESTTNDIETEAWTIGLRRVFGGNLKDRDRSSSPFGNVSTNFGGAFGTVFGAAVGSLNFDEGEEAGQDE